MKIKPSLQAQTQPLPLGPALNPFFPHPGTPIWLPGLGQSGTVTGAQPSTEPLPREGPGAQAAERSWERGQKPVGMRKREERRLGREQGKGERVRERRENDREERETGGKDKEGKLAV